jgi:hypothetical protein
MASRTAAKKDNLLTATQTVFKALIGLEPDLQNRVLASALSLLGISHSGAQSGSKVVETARPSAPSASSRPSLSPVELIREKEPATNAQRLAIFAYYRDKHEGKARFDRTDLKAYFANAKLPAPSYYDRDFNSAVKLGYIYEDGTDSYITSRGVEAVEAGFAGKGEPRGNAGRNKKKKKQKRKTSRKTNR